MADEEILLCGAFVDKVNRLFRWLAELRIERLVFGMPLAAVDGDRFQRVFDFRLRSGSTTEKGRKPRQHHSGIGSIQSHLEIYLLVVDEWSLHCSPVAAGAYTVGILLKMVQWRTLLAIAFACFYSDYDNF